MQSLKQLNDKSKQNILRFIKTTDYISVVVCSLRTDMKQEASWNVGLVCCFIPTKYCEWKVRYLDSLISYHKSVRFRYFATIYRGGGAKVAYRSP